MGAVLAALAKSPGSGVSREQIVAFRLASHNLATRLPAGSLLAAAGVCAIQNTPPGSASLALHARVSNITPALVEQALVKDKALLQAWSLRGAPHVFPVCDALLFTRGLLPLDDEARRHFLLGAQPALDKIGISATRVVELTAAAVHEVLDGRAATKDQLGVEVAARVAKELSAQHLAVWQSPSWYAAGQSVGESVVRFALPIVALRGGCCHAGRSGNEAYLARLDQWLGAPLPEVPLDQARAALVRRYLHAYGPSTAKHLAEWAGISPAQAAQAWALVADELVEIELGRRTAWLPQDDVAALASPLAAGGVRFLPPHDPYLQLRDRATLISNQTFQRQLWRSTGNPGVILANGEVAAMWRSQKRGKRLHITVVPITSLAPNIHVEIEAEAAGLISYWGCSTVEVVFASTSPSSPE